jgi:hypothetical protein
MSQISTDSYSYQNDLGSVHSNNSLPASEDLNDMTDLLQSWELSTRAHHISRGVPKFDDFHLLQSNSTPLGPGSKGQSQQQDHHHHHSQHYSGEDSMMVHPFDELNLKFKGSQAAPSSSSSVGRRARRHQEQQQHYVNPIDDLLANQLNKDCNLTNREFRSEDLQSHSMFFNHLYSSQNASQDASPAQVGSSALKCPERPFHLMKTHITLKLEAPSSTNELLLDDLENEEELVGFNEIEEQERSSSIAAFTAPPAIKKPEAAILDMAPVTALPKVDENNINNKSIDYIIDVVTSYLQTFSEFDFSYFPKSFLWKGKYLQGSSSCLINIHLYKDSKSSSSGSEGGDSIVEVSTPVKHSSLHSQALQQQFLSTTSTSTAASSSSMSLAQMFIIEANRITGDAKPFHEFFKEFKRLLLTHFQGVSTGGRPSNTNGFRSLTSPDSNSSSFDQEDYFFTSSARLNLCSSNSALNSPNPFQYNSSSHNSRSLGSSTPLPSPSLKKTSSQTNINCAALYDFHKSIEPILNMTKCIYYEVKLEAAKMLCDISLCEEFHSRADSKCIDNIFKAIESLILHNDGFLTVKEQAIVAFASFVNETNYNKEILNRMSKSSILYILLQLVSNPSNETVSYETLQMRRESARILSILAAYDAKQLVVALEGQSVHSYALKKWFDSIDYLKDQRMKIYAMKIRDLLSNVQI